MTARAVTPDISLNKFICTFFPNSFCYNKWEGTEAADCRWVEIQIVVWGRNAWIGFSPWIAWLKLQLKEKNEVSLIFCQEVESGVGRGLAQHHGLGREVQITP